LTLLLQLARPSHGNQIAGPLFQREDSLGVARRTLSGGSFQGCNNQAPPPKTARKS
jgi:hypothetical protein